jgi:phosphate transport system substrate-binding protein
MLLFSSALRRAVAGAIAASTVVALGAAVVEAQSKKVTLNGAGATFPAPLYRLYANEIKKKLPNMQINYQSIGSGGGIRQFTAGTVDFGASDAAMTDEQIAKVQRGVILVPTAGGAVTAAFNLPGVNELKLSRQTMGAIFSGQVTKWNDARLKKDNPGVNLPDSPMRVAVRADSSGTSFIFSNGVSGMDSYFAGRVGGSTTPKWPNNFLRGKGNEGVAALIKQSPGTIGYVEASYAEQNKLSTAAIQNSKGRFVKASIAEANKALDGIKFPDNFRVFEKNPDDGFPIVGLTWIMVYKQYKDPAKAAAIKEMVKWILTDGQELNGRLEYTKIPSSVAQRVISAVNSQVK